MRIPDVIPHFKRYALCEKGMQAKTIREMVRLTESFSKVQQHPTLKSIKTANIREYLHHQKQQRLWSNKTFRNKRQYLKSFFQYCLRQGYINDNPVDNIEKPKVAKSLPRCLTKQQVSTLLMHLDTYEWASVIEEKRNRAMIRTFLMTGVRLSELINLKSTSINFDESEILILQGKGKKDRIVPIHPELLPYLKSYQQIKRHRPNEYFFSSIRSDSKLTDKNIYRIVKKLRNLSGVYFSPHMLRHTFGKLAIENNLNPFKLKQIMGHSDIQTTQIYVSVSHENIKKSFQKLVLI